MFLSITVSEILTHIGRKSLPLVFCAPVRGETVRFTQHPLVTITRMTAYQIVNFDDTFSRFDTKHACDGRTDGQTDAIAAPRSV